ncbi:MAG: hypothetical protein HY331_17600 [Chloroflexi bacterium]|nr:hypothetical protein [Chloroflexota bacterium]
MSKILVLNPFGGEARELANCRAIARPDTDVQFANVAETYPLNHVQYRTYRIKATEMAVQRIVQAEQEGFDAVVISCSADPGLQEARELVDIPVVGALEATVHVASMLGDRFSILVVTDTAVPLHRDLVIGYGVAPKLASIRPIGYRPPVLYADVTPPDEVLEQVIRVGRRCVEEDGAEVIVLGGTLFSTLFTRRFSDPAEPLGVPALDPTLVAFKVAEMMVDLRRLARIPAVSRAASYQRPPREELARLASYYGWGGAPGSPAAR